VCEDPAKATSDTHPSFACQAQSDEDELNDCAPHTVSSAVSVPVSIYDNPWLNAPASDFDEEQLESIEMKNVHDDLGCMQGGAAHAQQNSASEVRTVKFLCAIWLCGPPTSLMAQTHSIPSNCSQASGDEDAEYCITSDTPLGFYTSAPGNAPASDFDEEQWESNDSCMQGGAAQAQQHSASEVRPSIPQFLCAIWLCGPPTSLMAQTHSIPCNCSQASGDEDAEYCITSDTPLGFYTSAPASHHGSYGDLCAPSFEAAPGEPHQTASAAGRSGEFFPADHALVQASIVDAVEKLVGRLIPVDQPLMTAGIDSRRAMELTDALEEKLGVDLPALLVFNYPNIDAVVGPPSHENQPCSRAAT
jgi:acyl carrier protein